MQILQSEVGAYSADGTRFGMLRSLDHVPVGILLYSEQAGVVAATPAFAEIVGYDMDAVMGARMRDFTHPDDMFANGWLLENSIRTQQPFTLVKRYLRPAGEVIWVENRYEVIQRGDREPFVVLLSRRLDALPPLRREELKPADYTSFVETMCLELAAMADANGHRMCSDLLRLAAKVSGDD